MQVMMRVLFGITHYKPLDENIDTDYVLMQSHYTTTLKF
jgi:hypothetical protein